MTARKLREGEEAQAACFRRSLERVDSESNQDGQKQELERHRQSEDPKDRPVSGERASPDTRVEADGVPRHQEAGGETHGACR